ncbi:MAG: hypothetical protein ACRETA_07695 [Gammaproteobacteria bacterium]
MRMTKAQKLADKIVDLKAALSDAKHAEAQATRKEAQHALNRAACTSGLLSLLALGTISAEALEREFRTVVGRVTTVTTEAVETTSATAGAAATVTRAEDTIIITEPERAPSQEW